MVIFVFNVLLEDGSDLEHGKFRSNKDRILSKDGVAAYSDEYGTCNTTEIRSE